MNFLQFINYNNRCPCCDSKLSIFMVTQSKKESFTWKYKKIDKKNGIITFSNNSLGIVNILFKNNVYLETDSLKILNCYVYFVYVCKSSISINNYISPHVDVNSFTACYSRSTPLLEIIKKDETYHLSAVDPDHKNIVNSDECVYFVDNNRDTNYSIILNYCEDTMYLVSYNRNKHNSRISLFKKELPLPKYKLNLHISNRLNLINKLNSWITLS